MIVTVWCGNGKREESTINTQKEKRNWRQHMQDKGLQIKQETEPKMQKNDSNLQTRHRTTVNKHGHKIN